MIIGLECRSDPRHIRQQRAATDIRLTRGSAEQPLPAVPAQPLGRGLKTWIHDPVKWAAHQGQQRARKFRQLGQRQHAFREPDAQRRAARC